jgi:hypothetical protein
MSISLDSFVAIPVPHALYARLAARYPGGVATLVETVVQDFLDRTEDEFEFLRSSRKGVHWESMFLPDGSQVRTKYYGDHQVADIAHGKIVWNGETYPSMSRLASAMRGDTSNNAWKVLEVKRPTDAEWQLADRLR